MYLITGRGSTSIRLVLRPVFVIALAAAILFSAPPATIRAQDGGPPKVNLDGLNLYADVAPEIREGRTFVSVRFLAEAMGLDVHWFPEQNLVVADWPAPPSTPTAGEPGAPEQPGTPAPAPEEPTAATEPPAPPQPPDDLPPDQAIRVYIAGTWLRPDVAPYIADGRTMVPLRFVAEALGLTVEWRGETRTVGLASAAPDRSYEALLGPGLNQAWLVDLDADGKLEIAAVYAPTASQGGGVRVEMLRRLEQGWAKGPILDLPELGPIENLEFVQGIGFRSLASRLGPQLHLVAGGQERLYFFRAREASWLRISWWAFRPDRYVPQVKPAAEAAGQDRIIISKRDNLLYFFQQGELARVYPVATGRSSGLTPEGTFPVAVKGVDPAWRNPEGQIVPGGIPENPLGTRWIGLNVNGDSGINYGVHGTNAPLSIGSYASSGCVRMLSEHVEDLYSLVRIGTAVEIRP